MFFVESLFGKAKDHGMQHTRIGMARVCFADAESPSKDYPRDFYPDF